MFIIVDQFANDSLLILYIYILVIPTYSNIDLIFTCIDVWIYTYESHSL